jgi:hypothetical protein
MQEQDEVRLSFAPSGGLSTAAGKPGRLENRR